MQRTDKYSEHSSIIWLVWPIGWVFVYELGDCGFNCWCSHLNFRYFTCFAIWLYILIMWCTHFRVNPHYIFALMSRNFSTPNRRNILNLSYCNETPTHNHLVLKRKLNHLGTLANLLGCVLSTYFYSAFGCMLLSCHVHISEWIHTIYLPECQGNLLLETSAISEV